MADSLQWLSERNSRAEAWKTSGKQAADLGFNDAARREVYETMLHIIRDDLPLGTS